MLYAWKKIKIVESSYRMIVDTKKLGFLQRQLFMKGPDMSSHIWASNPNYEVKRVIVKLQENKALSHAR